MPPTRLASSRHSAPSLRNQHRRLRWPTLLAALLIAACAAAVVTPASGVTKRLTARDGGSPSTATIGTLSNGTARAAFAIPKSRAATVTVGLELRRKVDGDSYQIRGTVTRSGVLRVAMVRHRGSTATLLTERTLPGRMKGGKTLWVEGSVAGTTPVVVQARVWLDGKAVPGWQATVSDTSPIRVTGSGSVKVDVALASTARSKKVTVRYRSTRVAASSTAARKPSATTTGVPAGTSLRVHNGNIVVTKAGTHLDRLDIHGFVTVKAPNVTISRSIVRGGQPPKTAQGLITNYGSKGLLITDTDLIPSHPSVYVDGIKGWNFTARRVHVVGNVDSVKIHGDNVTVEDSLLENTTWYAHDPYQNGGPTHNDNIQILKGRNLTIKGNTIRGATNFAVLGSADLGNVPNLVVHGNWLDGGHCTLKLQVLHKHSLRATVTDNRFGPDREVSYCPMQVLAGVKLTAKNNVSEQTGKPVQIWRKP